MWNVIIEQQTDDPAALWNAVRVEFGQIGNDEGGKLYGMSTGENIRLHFENEPAAEDIESIKVFFDVENVTCDQE